MWGAKTRGWAASINRLDEDKWKKILKAAVDKMDMSGIDEGDMEEGANGEPCDPHALIEL